MKVVIFAGGLGSRLSEETVEAVQMQKAAGSEI